MFSPESLKNSVLKHSLPEYVIFSNHSLRYRDWDKRAVMAKSQYLPIIVRTKRILDSLYYPVALSPKKIFVLYKLKQ